jgi:4-hydroxybenzoate polyprenyltransferase
VLVIVAFGATGLATFATGAPLGTGWLAGKFVLFAGVVTLGLLLRRVIRDWVTGFGEIRVEATRDAGNARVHAAHERAAKLALLLWLFVAATAFLGVVKPG